MNADPACRASAGKAFLDALPMNQNIKGGE
jgi:hypothetical protein